MVEPHCIRSAAQQDATPTAGGDDDDGEWVALQFDGTTFFLKRSTISMSAAGSLLDVMFGDTDSHQSSLLRRQCARNHAHPHRPFVFDRSARYVAPLMEYIRTGELIIDDGVSPRGVLLEAQYFGLTAVARMLRNEKPQFDDDDVADADDEWDDAIVDGGHREETCPIVSSSCSDSKTKKKRIPLACCTRADIGASLRALPMDVGLRLRGMCLNRISFAKLDLRNTNFELCALLECDFRDCELSNTNFTKCDATGSNFSGSTLSHAICLEANFTLCNFEKSRCTDSNFAGSTMTRLMAKQCDFSRSVLIHCDLSHADLCGTILHQTQLRHAILHGVERCGTNISMGGVIA